MKDVVDLNSYRRRLAQDQEDDQRLELEGRVRFAAESVANLMVRLNEDGNVELESVLGDRTIAFQPDLAIAVGELMVKLGKAALEEDPCPAG